MPSEKETENELDRLASRLCKAYAVHPGDTIPSSAEPKFRAYAGDTYMQWARDHVEIWMTIMSANLDRDR